ncbi:acyl carrier protein [Streptomyces murinus]|uniref:acyl carrier protein n=1 Tax=Streptomyces murinus TaxID=33900 RepID=UPI000A1FA192|nr:acyl carrier protein [Streptomyces murinus]WDO09731.1 acyl carrier protein [Streptomyces murinus]
MDAAQGLPDGATSPATGRAAGRDITADVIRSVAAMAKLSPQEISGGTRFRQDLDFDSTNILELLMRLEVEFDIEFDPDTFGTGTFETVDGLSAYVRESLDG